MEANVKTAFGRSRASLVLVALALLGVACNETKTPTEPAGPLIGATPTPTPTAAPTPIPQPASLSGTVTYHGTLDAGAIIGCQGRSTTTSSDGAYNLTGLMSGKTTVTVQYFPNDYPEGFPAELQPGSNEVDFDCGQGCNR